MHWKWNIHAINWVVVCSVFPYILFDIFFLIKNVILFALSHVLVHVLLTQGVHFEGKLIQIHVINLLLKLSAFYWFLKIFSGFLLLKFFWL